MSKSKKSKVNQGELPESTLVNYKNELVTLEEVENDLDKIEEKIKKGINEDKTKNGPYYTVTPFFTKKGDVQITITAKGKPIVKGNGYLDLLPKIKKLITYYEAKPLEAKEKGVSIEALKGTVKLMESEEGRQTEHIVQQLIELTKGAKKEPKKGSYNVAGHLKDQTLKIPISIQGKLFDSLPDDTKKKIGESDKDITAIAEGIQLTPVESKIVDCLCKLLHEKSQTNNPKDKDYYIGAPEHSINVEYGGEETKAPGLVISVYELAKEYTGGDKKISGTDIGHIIKILRELEEKQYLMRYTETTIKKGGGKIERVIELYNKLINVANLTERDYNTEDIEVTKKEDIVIILNPIFRRQIDSKFITYPNDFNKRLQIAYGNPKVSIHARKLTDYLMRELSSKRLNPQISLDKLYEILAYKELKDGRKKKVKLDTNKAIETVKRLGLITSYKIEPNKEGAPKIIFSINKDFNK